MSEDIERSIKALLPEATNGRVVKDAPLPKA